MRLQSGFAILDVKGGRKSLAERLKRGELVGVVIHGTIDSAHGSDDGESQEFTVDVTKVEVT